jgi:hypothetical protein
LFEETRDQSDVIAPIEISQKLIGPATKNKLLSMLIDALTDIQMRAFSALDMPFSSSLLDSRRTIVRRIAARDSAGATEEMIRYLTLVHEAIHSFVRGNAPDNLAPWRLLEVIARAPQLPFWQTARESAGNRVPGGEQPSGEKPCGRRVSSSGSSLFPGLTELAIWCFRPLGHLSALQVRGFFEHRRTEVSHLQRLSPFLGIGQHHQFPLYLICGEFWGRSQATFFIATLRAPAPEVPILSRDEHGFLMMLMEML